MTEKKMVIRANEMWNTEGGFNRNTTTIYAFPKCHETWFLLSVRDSWHIPKTNITQVFQGPAKTGSFLMWKLPLSLRSQVQFPSSFSSAFKNSYLDSQNSNLDMGSRPKVMGSSDPPRLPATKKTEERQFRPSETCPVQVSEVKDVRVSFPSRVACWPD